MVNKERNTYKLANIKEIDELKISKINASTFYDAIIIKTNFSAIDIGNPSVFDSQNKFILETQKLIDKASIYLKDGGLIFIYGLPNYLSWFGEYLSENKNDDFSFIFKYWIACEFKPEKSENSLPTSHVGLLMYLKTKSKKNVTPFYLNTKFVRLPYSNCPACDKTTKDWGGKKHLRNPLGGAISDVWTFNQISVKKANKIPTDLLERILALLSDGKEVLLVNQSSCLAELSLKVELDNTGYAKKRPSIKVNQVINDSCITYLNNLSNEHPAGTFDIAFADPPYNLAKNYSTYKDDLDDKIYIDWCNEWLEGMYRNLKPGGALLVLNIPKWSIFHFNFLSSKMIFRNWIVWDALSTPAGKLLPAHYSLLYFTKPGAEPIINIDDEQFITDRQYCLRAPCVKSRKLNGDDHKELLNDVWRDLHRIKHKKDRDHHPCQLPTKLMERIIKLFSNENSLVFDPFGGAGTSAIAAKLLKRNFLITELDKHYVEIANRNIEKVQLDAGGIASYKRSSVAKGSSNTIPKKIVEANYMNLCFEKNKILSEDELNKIDKEVYALVKQYSGDFQKLKSVTRRKMEAQQMLLFK
jgi:DNA modification methylase